MIRTTSLLAGASMLTLTLLGTTAAQAKMPSAEEMWQVIQEQQKQIKALKNQITRTDKKTEAVADSLDEAIEHKTSSVGTGNGWWDKTSIGGYGELHYNNRLDSSGNDEIDFHRFVLFFGHEFTDDIRLFTELELEHALSGEGKNGAVELEQAFVEFDLNEHHKAQAGVFLLPVGLLNETHEPPTFYGAERNPVEKNIIPTTWWEGGAALKGELGDGFSYFAGLHSGLNVPTTGSNAFKIRNGRQKVSAALAEDGAVTAGLTYSGMPGVKLGLSGQYQSDITQNSFTENVSATLLEAHADIKRGPWGLRALYARWDLDGNAAKALGRDEQVGFYIEPSYRFTSNIGDMGLFARYNYWDNEAGNGTLSSGDNEQFDFGLNYWPHDHVVLKADIAFLEDTSGTDSETINLGVGYHF